MEKEKYLEKAVAWAERKPTISLKATIEGYEDPKTYKSKSTDEVVQADLSFITNGGAKHYTEVALKKDNPKDLVVKWKVLSFMASMKRGKLHLLAPKGHKAFTLKLVRRHNINAVVHPI
ncbi:hypothetical protein [Aquimarina algicola]|uniref:Uncharacterized protein n=1 Tax=Aquimarina algicola TaxID=2589995 RepID=A0A504J9E7_9FLAO|nr:hypothetical protein [Aquimarina algicola]TPN84498.1 hypothetical protein FHK87_16325 [Aquimarina algicola]